MKKFLLGITALFGLVFALLLILPQVYSIDHLRPKMVEEINKQVSGTVSIDRLDFRLFPSLRFRIEGIKASQPGYKPETWLELSSVNIDVALWSLLTKPKADLVVLGPKFHLQKGPDGKFNFEEFLAKTSTKGSVPPTSKSESSEETKAPPADLKAVLDQLPGWIKGIIYAARFSAVVEDGALNLQDSSLLKKGDKIALSDLSFRLKNIGLDTPMELDSSIGFDVAHSGVLLKGPFTGRGSLQVVPVDRGLKLKIDLDESFDKTDLRFSDLFRKSAGRALGARFAGEITTQDGALNVNLPDLELRLDKTRLGGSLSLKNFSAESMGDLDLKLAAKDVDLAGFGVLVPMVNDYSLEGKTDLSVSALGSPVDPALLIVVELRGIGGATPELKRPLKDLNGRIRISGSPKNPTVVVGPLSMGLGVSDLAVQMSAKGLQPTLVDLNLDSKLLNADELLGLEALRLDAPAKSADGKKADAPPVASGKSGKAAPLDASLSALAPTINETLANPALDLAQLNFKGKIGSLVALGADYRDIQTSINYKNRLFTMERSQIKAYGGKLQAYLQLGLKPQNFTYKFDSGLEGVDFEELLATHMPTFKEVLTGKMTGSMAISGQGLEKAALEKNLRGSINGRILSGTFDLPMLTIVETIAESMPKISKMATSAGVDIKKQVGSSRAKGAFKTMDLDAKIVGRELQLDRLEIEYDPEYAGGQLLFKAKGKITFDQKLALVGTLFADPKLLKVQEAKSLKGKSGLAEVPLKIGGTIEDPKPDYAHTLEFVAKRVLKDKAVGAATKEIEKIAGKEAAEAVSQVLKDPKKVLNKKTQNEAKKKLKKLFK